MYHENYHRALAKITKINYFAHFQRPHNCPHSLHFPPSRHSCPSTQHPNLHEEHPFCVRDVRACRRVQSNYGTNFNQNLCCSWQYVCHRRWQTAWCDGEARHFNFSSHNIKRHPVVVLRGRIVSRRERRGPHALRLRKLVRRGSNCLLGSKCDHHE